MNTKPLTSMSVNNAAPGNGPIVSNSRGLRVMCVREVETSERIDIDGNHYTVWYAAGYRWIKSRQKWSSNCLLHSSLEPFVTLACR